MKGLTVLSDLMPRHILTSVLWESKPSLGCKFSILGYHHSFPATRLCVTNYHIGAWGPGHGSMLRILSRRQCTDWERAVEMGGWEGRRPQCPDGGFRWLRRPQSRPSFSSAGICFKCMFWQICKTYFILFYFVFYSFFCGTRCSNCWFCSSHCDTVVALQWHFRDHQWEVPLETSCPYLAAQGKHAESPLVLVESWRVTVVGLWHLEWCPFLSVLVSGLGFGLLSKFLCDSPKFLQSYKFEY